MLFFAPLMCLTSTLFYRVVSKLLIIPAATLDEMLIFCKVFNAWQLVKMVNCSQVYKYSLSFVQANTIAAILRSHILSLVWDVVRYYLFLVVYCPLEYHFLLAQVPDELVLKAEFRDPLVKCGYQSQQ